VVLLSVPEGDDKPAKYPVMFRAADLVMISKSDLLPVLDDFKVDTAKKYLRDIASNSSVIEISSKDKSGMPLWLDWINQRIEQRKSYLKTFRKVSPLHLMHGHHHIHNKDSVK
jgi:hydrogenase nickel incorporation protein HypB